MKIEERIKTFNLFTFRLYNIEFYKGRIYKITCKKYPSLNEIYTKYSKNFIPCGDDKKERITPKDFNEFMDNLFLDKDFKDFDKLLKNLYNDPVYLKIAQERIQVELNKSLERPKRLSDALCSLNKKDKNQ